MKVLAVDWGRAHIGLAVSDDSGRWAFPRGEFSPEAAVAEIEKILDRENVQHIIFGDPLPLSGAPGAKGVEQRRDIRTFAEDLSSRLPVSVEFFDERFTNMREAASAYPEAGEHERAAAVLLQDYLAWKKP